jgi:uncharacterized protein (DUF736 family)
MANIGTFTAQNDGFTGSVRTLTLNVKVKFVPNDKGSPNALLAAVPKPTIPVGFKTVIAGTALRSE